MYVVLIILMCVLYYWQIIDEQMSAQQMKFQSTVTIATSVIDFWGANAKGDNRSYAS